MKKASSSTTTTPSGSNTLIDIHMFSPPEDFRYRPGITYRGIANYQHCLYLAVTEMNVAAGAECCQFYFWPGGYG